MPRRAHPGTPAAARSSSSATPSVGHAGELHPRVCAAYGVPARTAAAEIDLTRLLEHAVDDRRRPAVLDFPVAKEDVALVVDDSVAAADVEAALREGAGELLESVRLFDVYTGPQVGEGKKSLAFALRFRAPDRTLTEPRRGRARRGRGTRPSALARRADRRRPAEPREPVARLTAVCAGRASSGSRQLIGWWMTAPEVVDDQQVAGQVDRVTVAAPPQPGVDHAGGRGDHRVGLDARGRRTTWMSSSS